MVEATVFLNELLKLTLLVFLTIMTMGVTVALCIFIASAFKEFMGW